MARRTFAHLVTTPAEESHCHRCHGETLVGLEEGLTVRVDRQPIARTGGDLSGEVAALVAGLDTFVLTAGRELCHREPHRIREGRPTGTIHARHQCQATTLADLWSAAA